MKRNPNGIRIKDLPKFTCKSNHSTDVSFENLQRWIDSQVLDFGLNLNPSFRRAGFWTIAQKQKFIEFIVMGGVSGRDIYFNCPSYNHRVNQPYNEMVVVDGKQRIDAVLEFINNEFKIFEGLQSVNSGNGIYAKDLEFIPFDWSFKIFVNDLKTEEEVLDWYIRINSTQTLLENDKNKEEK